MVEGLISVIRKALHRVCEYKLPISLEKSIFNVKKVDLFSYVRLMDEVIMNEKNVESIKAWRAPAMVNNVHIFLGFANIDRLFIKNLAPFCAQISDLLQGDTT